jgi:hypothetical protein
MLQKTKEQLNSVFLEELRTASGIDGLQEKEEG